MKVTDIIFALVIGRFISFLLGDFLEEWGISLIPFEFWLLWIIIPLFSLFCLWLAYLIGRKFLFIYQAAKHLLVGTFVTIVDLKIFEFLVWFFGILTLVNPLAAKAISFIVATLLKYLGNKYWAFQKHGREDLKREVAQFFYITLFTLVIDIGMFYYLTSSLGPQFGIPIAVWTKLSVILAGLSAATLNFLGYKFLVFKK